MVRNLVRYLDDPDDGVRLAATRSIEALADPQAPGWAVTLAQEAVARELADPVEGVRLCALRTLDKVGDQGAQEQLIAALADPSDLVRQQASAGLVAQGRAAAPALEALLVEGESPELPAQGAALVLARMARERIVGAGEGQRYLRQVDALFEDTLRRVYADVRLLAALEPLRPGQRRPARRSPAGLDSLLPGGARRRSRPGGAGPREDSGGVEVLQLLGEGLRQRNERRLDGAFRLLSATRRGPASSIDVIVGALLGSSAGSAARANALEALESLTSSRLAHLLGGVVPFPAPDLAGGDGAALAGLVAVGEREWALEPFEAGAALEAVVADADRWLAAMGIVALADTGLFEAATVQEAWWPVWQADPDPAVREAACYAARRMNLEVEMVDTTEMATLETLSAVERAIFLKQIPFFGAMTVDQLRTLAGIAEEQDYDEAETIFAEGDLGEALYVVVRGRVAIEREPREGQVQRLETLSARQYFGERTIFDGAPHENRAVALERVHLLTIRREPLLALVRRSPDLSLSLVTVLSQRLREADSKLAAKTRPKPDQVMRLYDKLTGEE